MAAWNLRPIASALWRNRTGATLVAFQIAIGLAVLVNAVYVVKQRVELIGRPTGMDTANMIWVASAGFAKDFDYWHASRVIASGDTINEFPFFTFFHADLHPHLLAFPFFLATFAVADRWIEAGVDASPGEGP